MENKKISIIIAMRNEENYLSKCLDSLLASDYRQEDMEIIVVNSMSTDKSPLIILEYMLKYKMIKYYDNPNIYTPFAFNIGIKHATGEYIFIVSAHCKYDTDYFLTLVNYAVKLKADAIGAVSKTGVIHDTLKAHSIKSVLSNKFGVGNSYFRTGTDKVIEVDAISGCYHKSVFEKYGYYNENLIRNQDIELNKRIKNAGGKLYLIPYTSYTYFVRENFKALAKNNYDNGFWNILTVYYTKSVNSLSLRHFIPLFFILSLFVPFLLSFFVPALVWISILSLGSYLALVIMISLKLKKNTNSFFHLLNSFLTLHSSYGIGSLMGIIALVKHSIKGTK